MPTDSTTSKPGLMRTLRDRLRRTKSNLRRGDTELVRRGDDPPSTSWGPLESMRQMLRLEPSWLSDGDLWAPMFEVRENAQSLRIVGDLPGVNREDIEINVVDNYVTVSGRRETEERIRDEQYLARERSFGQFRRSFTLPDHADFDHITSTLDNGVLTIVVPKLGHSKARKIAIGGSAPKS